MVAVVVAVEVVLGQQALPQQMVAVLHVANSSATEIRKQHLQNSQLVDMTLAEVSLLLRRHHLQMQRPLAEISLLLQL